MDSQHLDPILHAACNSQAMCRLDALARELSGVGLLVIWSCDGHHAQIPVCGNADALPRFCQLVHGAPEGMDRCVTCHSLLALAARNRGGVTEGRCHGGTCVFAAPAVMAGLLPEAEIVVITSCAFTLTDRQQGWRTTRRVATDLGIDLNELRRAYKELPDLHGEKLKLVGDLVAAAAAALTEALRSRVAPVAPFVTPSVPAPGGRVGVEERLRTALAATDEAPYRHAAGTRQSSVTDVVMSVIGANPELPMTVADIAAAAHMTPNHFSLIFRRQTGKTFSEFLAEVRFKRAETCLRNRTLSVGEVARECGFSDPNYFARVFRKRTGLSPSAWRRERRRRRPAA